MTSEPQPISLSIDRGQAWGVVGRNGSGKSSLAIHLLKENHLLFSRPAIVSFELEDQLLEREIREDDSEFMDRQDPGRTVRELLEEVWVEGALSIESLSQDLGMIEYLDRGFRLLSTGERRRLMVARALAQLPDLLILDEPFDGVDQDSRHQLSRIIEKLRHQLTLVIVVNRMAELEAFVDHVFCVEHGSCVFRGSYIEAKDNQVFQQLVAVSDPQVQIPQTLSGARFNDSNIIPVEMREVSVIHGGREVISNLTWKVERGQNWKISGPNGCGKSTLVNLVSGDHPQCYSNDVSVMGMRRGFGETIWEIKEFLGIVSPSLHQLYRVSTSAISTVLSGFFDSVGVYQEVSPDQVKIARQWLDLIGLHRQSEVPFRSLSFGQQRLLLIARALVKQPALLILDEPCQGLDPLNRALVLKVIDRIVSSGLTQLLYITHEPEDQLVCLTHHLRHDGRHWIEEVLSS